MSQFERMGLVTIVVVSIILGALLVVIPPDDTATAIEGCTAPPETTVETFETIQQAEALLCFEVQHPRRLGSWRFVDVSARVYSEGERTAVLHYRSDTSGASFSLVVILNVGRPSLDRVTTCVVVIRPGDCLHASQKLSFVPLRGTVATLRQGGGRGPKAVEVRWREDGATFISQAILSERFVLDDLLRILKSIS
jgi:hypothetical protein